jgi:hypothetical protein
VRNIEGISIYPPDVQLLQPLHNSTGSRNANSYRVVVPRWQLRIFLQETQRAEARVQSPAPAGVRIKRRIKPHVFSLFGSRAAAPVLFAVPFAV